MPEKFFLSNSPEKKGVNGIFFSKIVHHNVTNKMILDNCYDYYYNKHKEKKQEHKPYYPVMIIDKIGNFVSEQEENNGKETGFSRAAHL